MSFLFSGSAELGARLPVGFASVPVAAFAAFDPEIVLFGATTLEGRPPDVLAPVPGGRLGWFIVVPEPLILDITWFVLVT